jgi:hypothetical protein
VGSTKGHKVPVSTRRCLNNVRCLRNVRKGEGGGQGPGSDDLGHESGRRKGCSDGPVDAPRGRGVEGHPTGLKEGRWGEEGREGGRGGRGTGGPSTRSLYSRPSTVVWPRTAVVICAARSSMPISLPEGHSSPGLRRVLALSVP